MRREVGLDEGENCHDLVPVPVLDDVPLVLLDFALNLVAPCAQARHPSDTNLVPLHMLRNNGFEEVAEAFLEDRFPASVYRLVKSRKGARQ